jgi:hypothetical protein
MLTYATYASVKSAAKHIDEQQQFSLGAAV